MFSAIILYKNIYVVVLRGYFSKCLSNYQGNRKNTGEIYDLSFFYLSNLWFLFLLFTIWDLGFGERSGASLVTEQSQ